MKKYIVLALFAIVFQGMALSACRIYSLQSPCSIAFSDSRKVVHADHVEIAATEDVEGRVSSPFKVCGYDKDGKLIYNTVFGAHCSDTNGVPEVLLADIPEKVVVHRNVVLDDLSIGDSHFRISTKKPSGEFLILVEDLDAQRLDAEVAAQVARIRANDIIAGSAEWPQMDDGRRYRCSSSEFVRIQKTRDGESSDTAGLRLKGALYQKGKEVSVHFALSREHVQSLGEMMKGDGETLAEGRVVCEISDGEITKSVVTYDLGEGVVEASISLPIRNETRGMGARNAFLEKELEKRGVKERPVRLNLAYGATKTKIDLDMQCDDR